MVDEKQIDAALRDPFQLDELEWRVQLSGKMKNKPGDKAMMLPYVDARAIMRRFSKVLGVGHWRTETRHDGPETWVCRIWAKIGDEWVWHEDVSDETDIEATKGGASKALVRCAVRFGVGAYLYEMDFQWVTLEGSGDRGYAPRNWKPDISKIPAAFRPSKLGGAAQDAPPARIAAPAPPEEPKKQTAPAAGLTPFAADVAKALEKIPSPKALDCWNSIVWAHNTIPVPFMLSEMVPSKDASKPAEPYVFFAEAALRQGSEREKSGHWQKLRWVLDKWPEKDLNVKSTNMYRKMAMIEEWASKVRESTDFDPLGEEPGSDGN